MRICGAFVKMLRKFSQHFHHMLTTFSTNSRTFSPHSHHILTTFSPNSHQILTKSSPHSHQLLIQFSPKFSPNSEQFSPMSVHQHIAKYFPKYLNILPGYPTLSQTSPQAPPNISLKSHRNTNAFSSSLPQLFPKF